MEKVSKFLKRYAHWAVVIGSLLICGFFLLITHPSKSGEYRTLDGNDAQIYESTEKIMEEAREAIIEAKKKYDIALEKLDYKIGRYEIAQKTGELTWD